MASTTQVILIAIVSLSFLFQGDLERTTGVDYYRIRHADWNGVGIFDGEFYYTVFQINDKADPPERRGNWGAHVAKWRAKSKSFEVLGIELKEKSNSELLGIELTEESDSDHLAGQWIWQHDLE